MDNFVSENLLLWFSYVWKGSIVIKYEFTFYNSVLHASLNICQQIKQINKKHIKKLENIFNYFISERPC